MLIAKRACTAFRQTISNDRKNDLYYSTSPVPGLYTENSNGERFLVALKPNGRKDTEAIFRHNPKEDSMVHLANSRANSFDNILLQVTSKNNTTTISKSADIDSAIIEINTIPNGPYANYLWNHSNDSVASATTTYYSRNPVPNPPPNTATTSIASITSSSGKSSISFNGLPRNAAFLRHMTEIANLSANECATSGNHLPTQ